ncbi:hypothetical protein [Salinarimonas ramus]|uniref:hypothetical protein n=1 Tax=Salinarimonas ramus TaxID=690164 RepID=UPI00166DFB59|nr:hypothetical protein [Salinarimonas ramus]
MPLLRALLLVLCLAATALVTTQTPCVAGVEAATIEVSAQDWDPVAAPLPRAPELPLPSGRPARADTLPRVAAGSAAPVSVGQTGPPRPDDSLIRNRPQRGEHSWVPSSAS